jgi:hypothetical protein
VQPLLPSRPAPQRCSRLLTRAEPEGERQVIYNKEFGYSRKDVLIIIVALIAAGVLMYEGLQAAGMSAGMAGNWVQLIIFMGICVGWVSTYLWRVANKVRVHAVCGVLAAAATSIVSWRQVGSICISLGCWRRLQGLRVSVQQVYRQQVYSSWSSACMLKRLALPTAVAAWCGLARLLSYTGPVGCTRMRFLSGTLTGYLLLLLRCFAALFSCCCRK